MKRKIVAILGMVTAIALMVSNYMFSSGSLNDTEGTMEIHHPPRSVIPADPALVNPGALSASVPIDTNGNSPIEVQDRGEEAELSLFGNTQLSPSLGNALGL